MTTISAPIATSNPWNAPLTPYQRFRRNPSLFLAERLYSYRPPLDSPPRPNGQSPVKIVCISDTHTQTPTVPDGDILLHAGDLTNTGTFAELQAQLDWLNGLPHAQKLVVAGNHDLLLDVAFCDQFPYRMSEEPSATREDLNWGSIIYLDDDRTTLTVRGRKITIFGSPLTPQCGTWAFQHPPIRDVWKGKVPEGTDVLVTHGPPRGHLDLAGKGCEWLTRELWRKRPRLVVFGHIHRARGVEELRWDFIEQVYDGVHVGERGLASVLAMAVVLVSQMMWFWVMGRNASSTTLVNAAVVAEDENSEKTPATIIEI